MIIGLRQTIAAIVISSFSCVAAAAGISDADKEFMTKAAQANQLEIQASILAEKSAESPEVKEFASHMVKDHGDAEQNLKQIAQDKGLSLPAGLSDDKKDTISEINALQGAEFDRKYAAEIGVKAHDEAVSLFEEASKHAKDEDVKAFAEKTLPVLKKHQEMGKELHQSIEKSK